MIARTRKFFDDGWRGHEQLENEMGRRKYHRWFDTLWQIALLGEGIVLGVAFMALAVAPTIRDATIGPFGIWVIAIGAAIYVIAMVVLLLGKPTRRLQVIFREIKERKA